MDHYVAENESPLKKRTRLGGFLSILFILVILVGFVSILYRYLFSGADFTRSTVYLLENSVISQ